MQICKFLAKLRVEEEGKKTFMAMNDDDGFCCQKKKKKSLVQFERRGRFELNERKKKFRKK